MHLKQDNLIPLHPLIIQQGVMVVDDSDFQRSVVVGLLRKIGVPKIYEVSDGIAALEMITNSMELPAVIIIDLNMPRMDG